MSNVALVALVVVAFMVGLAVGVLAVAVCVAGAREDAWRHGYMRSVCQDYDGAD